MWTWRKYIVIFLCILWCLKDQDLFYHSGKSPLVKIGRKFKPGYIQRIKNPSLKVENLKNQEYSTLFQSILNVARALFFNLMQLEVETWLVDSIWLFKNLEWSATNSAICYLSRWHCYIIFKPRTRVN
jgi:hypothetical protein